LVKEEWELDSLPVSPLLVAEKAEIACVPMPSSTGGVSGMLLKVGDTFGIQYATHIASPGFQNFSIAHELGHYYLPGHPERALVNGQHRSEAGYSSHNSIELEADQFACGMLMPSFLFDPALDRAGEGLEAIISLATLCKTSLTATAIRYAMRHTEPTAIVMSRNGIIDYCFMSDELKQFRGITWPKKGEGVPRGTKSKAMSTEQVLREFRAEGASDLATWFKSSRGGEVYEEAVGLGGYGRLLTVLSCSDSKEQQDDDEDEDLEESWKPSFKR
jgi:Zn-dependent peptidase ImmA (M78 family)